ncbi:hypothetical protein SAMN05192540_3997 [Maribacter dokdonensis]|uniref:Lipocalin-like domain-containing protein n=1 Tax=Maribacter dokdonensis TaxID=320912 RepID=A0A1H4V2L9_9FLAO|nr:hypothetical protein [Maribacter dokdonensis]SEC75309.1 hypothetical protein SAMN05192540_3997 [Maribacter dokdonensis]
MKYIIMNVGFLLALSQFIACDTNDDSNDGTQVSVSETNLKGTWKIVSKFSGQPNDSIGTETPETDYFASFEDCRKDDTFAYTLDSDESGNAYIWYTGSEACEGQSVNDTIQLGTWTLRENGQLNISYSDVSEPSVITNMTTSKFTVRKKSGTITDNGTIYEFTGYQRVD